ncbi:MAG: hypothetical protein HY675_05795 [Chloroflexi bacterium]|nr:hypothetical protein [Chloroflexota bacterium]
MSRPSIRLIAIALGILASLQKDRSDINVLVDHSFAKYAAEQLGAYR